MIIPQLPYEAFYRFKKKNFGTSIAFILVILCNN
jgi:hypothetical protein